jgi:hypothetical protein
MDDPIGYEKCPGERDNGADDGRHDEAIAVHWLVRIDDLENLSVTEYR